MLAQLLNLVLGTLCDLLSFAFLARFYMQWARAPFHNPIGHFIVVVTDWAVRPMRKLVPGLLGLDLASFLLAWLVQAVYLVLMIGVTSLYGGMSGGALGIALGIGLLETIRILIYLAIGLVIITALLSWINPYAPLAPFFNQLAAPLLRPAQRLIPPIGGLDLSPLLVLLALQALLIVLDHLRAGALPFFLS
jgi:YggT family protein